MREAGLEAIPTDPYSGKPLLYKVVNGKPIVYSVGSDQQDNQAESDWDYGKQPGDYIFTIGDRLKLQGKAAVKKR